MNNQLQENLKQQLEEVEKKLREAEALRSDPGMTELAGEEIRRLAEEDPS